jgi:hypothetical protein
VERNKAVPTTNRYSLTGNTAIKLTQAKNFSNSPSGTTFWAQGVAEDRFGCYILALFRLLVVAKVGNSQM